MSCHEADKRREEKKARTPALLSPLLRGRIGSSAASNVGGAKLRPLDGSLLLLACADDVEGR